MYYCLTSKRQIGNYSQNISSYQSHSPVNKITGSVNPLVRLHSQFRNKIKDLDGDWDTSELDWLDMQCHEDYDDTASPYESPACTAILTLCRPDTTAGFAVTTVKLRNVSVDDFTDEIVTAYYNLTGYDLTNSSVKDTTYITNAVIKIHPKEDEQNVSNQ